MKHSFERRSILAVCAAISLIASLGAAAPLHCKVRIKDVTSVAGMDGKQLIGYGLIVGLNGTGDGSKSVFTVNSIVSMLEKLGITVSPSEIKVKNVAAVVATAEIPPFTPLGTRVDVTVSSLGDASSLEGGQLLLTPLRGADGITHAIAQGAVSIGGFNISAGAGNVVRKNHATVGHIPEGALIKEGLGGQLASGNKFVLVLDDPDFQSATNITNSINKRYRMKLASSMNSRMIEVRVHPTFEKNPVSFIAEVGGMEVLLDKAARVVINERTGTVVVGGNVSIDKVAIAHGNIKVEIRASYGVSQPWAFSEGQSLVVPEIETKVEDKVARLFAIRESNTVSDIASALNELGITPRDMIAIFQALKRAGALKADLVIM